MIVLFQAYSCYLRPGGFRGLCWSFWLRLLEGPDPAAWVVEWQKRRASYSDLKAKYLSAKHFSLDIVPDVT